jgi:branched-chain amino acid transport system permease protein
LRSATASSEQPGAASTVFFIVVEQILNGLVVGAYYILLALGLSLVFSLGGVVNLAHGAFYALGAYLAVTVANAAGFYGALVVAPVAVALIGMAIETLFLRRLYQEDATLGLLFTFGLALTAEQAIRLIWGTTGLPFSIPPSLAGVLKVSGFLFSNYRLAILVVAMAAIVSTWLLLNKTAFGMVVRAGTSDPEMVRALGIRLRPVLTAIFGLGVGIAGLAGAMSAPLAGVQPAMGTEILTATFVIVVIGGLGSFWGVVLAGVLVGLVKGLTVLVYPPAAEAAMYALMVLVLLVRPRGLFGERMDRLEA